MFRGRAALRVFGIDSFANDAGTRPCQWILGRISRAGKGYRPSVFPFLCVVREPTVGAHENLAGWSLPVRAQRKRVRGCIAIAFRFDSATWQWIWRAVD